MSAPSAARLFSALSILQRLPSLSPLRHKVCPTPTRSVERGVSGTVRATAGTETLHTMAMTATTLMANMEWRVSVHLKAVLFNFLSIDPEIVVTFTAKRNACDGTSRIGD